MENTMTYTQENLMDKTNQELTAIVEALGGKAPKKVKKDTLIKGILDLQAKQAPEPSESETPETPAPEATKEAVKAPKRDLAMTLAGLLPGIEALGYVCHDCSNYKKAYTRVKDGKHVLASVTCMKDGIVLNVDRCPEGMTPTKMRNSARKYSFTISYDDADFVIGLLRRIKMSNK